MVDGEIHLNPTIKYTYIYIYMVIYVYTLGCNWISTSTMEFQWDFMGLDDSYPLVMTI